jgi:hypothetical protein
VSSGNERDFWLNSGFHLLDKDESGRLIVTDDFLRAYLCRPEIRPLEDSSRAEFEFHAALMDEPRMVVSAAHVDAIEDEDVRDNYRVLFEFRTRLLDADSLESCYTKIFSSGNVNVPPLLIDQMVHIILRNILDGCHEPLRLRAAELFFRKQRASIQDGAVMLADFDVIEAHASGTSFGSIGRLIAEAQTPLKNVSLDVLERENSGLYWERDQRHDFVIRINHGAPAAQCLCDVIEQWILHFCNVKVKVRTISAIEESRWAWHIGLDSAATALLNDLWQGTKVESARLERLLCLYRMEFTDASDMRSDIAGRPVYLALCMDPDGGVRVKPQNLLMNLPIAGGH